MKLEVNIDGIKYVPEKSKSDGWIKYDDGDCPVHRKTVIQRMYAAGDLSCEIEAGSFAWGGYFKDTHYKIIKEYVEPETKLKLIDWSLEGMVGCITNYGKLIKIVSKNAFIVSDFDRYSPLPNLRLKEPKEYEGWVSAFNFKDKEAVLEKLHTQCEMECRYRSLGGDYELIAFRVLGLAEGYTDDPAKAGV